MSVCLLQSQNRNSSIPPAAKNFISKQQRPGNESHGFPAAGCSLLKLQPQSPILPSGHSSAKPAGYIFPASHSGYAADDGTTDIIYDYFYSRILFGYFLPGDQLPSISYICRQFQVSALIVRTAFARLREEGMLETIERKGSTVTYRPGKEQGRLYRESFLSRREGMEDICRHSDIIFGSMAQVYMQKQTEDSIHQIRTQLKKRKGHPAKQITMFYAEAMQPLNNPLAINLHWEIVRYLRIPYFEAANFGDTGIQAEDHIERMLTLIEAGNAEKR